MRRKGRREDTKMNTEKSWVDKVRQGEGLDLAELICPICLCILINPVEMPCQHIICSPCFQETVTHSNTCCPVCRVRLSTWCHHATRNQSLVCRPLWNYIQATYPGEVSARLAGEDKTDPDEMFPCVPNHQFAVEVCLLFIMGGGGWCLVLSPDGGLCLPRCGY